LSQNRTDLDSLQQEKKDMEQEISEREAELNKLEALNTSLVEAIAQLRQLSSDIKRMLGEADSIT
jgi:cell division septum initiation protein DivIVA